MSASDLSTTRRSERAPDGARVRSGRIDGRLVAVAFVLLALLEAWLALTHAFWRDEAQAFLLAKHAHGFADLVHDLPYEGHPALWYFLLRAASTIDGSSLTLGVVQAIVGLSTMFLIRRASPFSPWVAFLVAANYFVFFEYGVFARSYGLGCLLFFLFMTYRRHWIAWPLLALMANVEFHFALLSVACIGMLLIADRRWSWTGFLVWLVGCAATAATAFPNADVDLVKMPADWGVRALYLLASSAILILPVDPLHAFSWGPPTSIWESSLGVVTPFLIWQAIGKNKRAGVAALALFAAVSVATLVVYPASARHIGVVFLYVVGWEWIAAERGRAAPSRATLAWLASSSAFCACAVVSILAMPLTRTHEIAGWIRAQGLASATWAAEPPWYGVDLAASLDRPIYNAHDHCLAWFEKWRVGARREISPEALGRSLAAAAAAAGGRLYFMTDFDTKFQVPVGAADTRLTTFPASATEGRMSIWEIDAPVAAGRTLPACS